MNEEIQQRMNSVLDSIEINLKKHAWTAVSSVGSAPSLDEEVTIEYPITYSLNLPAITGNPTEYFVVGLPPNLGKYFISLVQSIGFKGAIDSFSVSAATNEITGKENIFKFLTTQAPLYFAAKNRNFPDSPLECITVVSFPDREGNYITEDSESEANKAIHKHLFDFLTATE